MSENLGIDVQVKFSQDGAFHGAETTFHNITKIHYGYESLLGVGTRIAFESDVHGTGNTYDISDIAEFESKPATKKSENL